MSEEISARVFRRYVAPGIHKHYCVVVAVSFVEDLSSEVNSASV
jgi:hypothetical protein